MGFNMMKHLIVAGAMFGGLNAFAVEVSVVQQSLTSKSGKDTLQEKHTWFIDATNFRLDADLPGRQASYIFNGKNLFACLRVTDVSVLANISKDASKFKERLQSGLCLAAPINIASSFYISPHNSISALDITESLQLTLNLDHFKSAPVAGTSASSATPCSQSKREYKYTYFAYLQNKDLTNVATESACLANDLNWRGSMWKQLSRTLLQQKQGRTLRTALDGQKVSEQGVEIAKTGTYEILDGKKSLRKIETTLSTQKVSKENRPDSIFAVPAGYEMIGSIKDRSAETVAAKSADTKDDAEAGTAKASEAKSDEGIIPAILRTFIGLPY
jgi:hypothetical protein